MKRPATLASPPGGAAIVEASSRTSSSSILMSPRERLGAACRLDGLTRSAEQVPPRLAFQVQAV